MFVNKIGKTLVGSIFMKLRLMSTILPILHGDMVSRILYSCTLDLRRLEQGIGTVGKEVSDITDLLQTLHRRSVEEQEVGPSGSALQRVPVGGHLNIDGAVVGEREEPVDSCRNKVGADAASETEGVHMLPFE